MKDKIILITEKLFKLNPSEYEVATGSLIYDKTKHIFAIQNQDRWRNLNNRIEAGLVGIGGKLEQGESVIQCLKRECMEELGSKIKIIDSEQTFTLTKGSISQLNSIESQPRPFLIILLERTEEGRKPFTVVFTYKCIILNTPRPLDVSALFVADDSVLFHLVSGPKTIEFLLEKNAEIIERIKLPRNLYIRPYGTLTS